MNVISIHQSSYPAPLIERSGENPSEFTSHCKDGKGWNKFIVSDGFVFRANKLCIPASSVCLLLLQEAHGGGLMGHFGAKKTEDILADHFFWPRMKRHVERFVARCTTCKRQSHG